MKQRSPKSLLAKLADGVMWMNLLLPGKKHPPGHFVKNLSPEKREILSRLKSDDIKNDRHFYQGKWK